MRHEISKENYDKLYPGIVDTFGVSQEKEEVVFKPSQLISRADIDDAYDNLSRRLEATTLMFEYEQRANMPLREKVEELAAELTHNSINFEREIEAWKRGSEAQATEIDFLRKNLNATAEEYDSALGKIARLQIDLHQTVVAHDNYKSALKKIARTTLEPGHVYEQAVMMQDIAIKVLQEEHGCTVMGAKVCFACGECDPLTSADLGKNCGGEL